MDYPRWLYSKDHGSVVVDTEAQVLQLPGVDWYASPDFASEPAFRLTKPNYVETDRPAGMPAIDNGTAPAINAALAKIEAAEEAPQVRLDRRTKEYKASQP